jgi:SAM-dependent methyltransferase
MNEIKTTCPICNCSNISHISKYRSNNINFIGVNLVICNDCNLVFANPKLDDEFLEKYNSEYFKSAHGGIAKDNLTLAFFAAIAKLRYTYIQKYLLKNKLKINSILEIGPGSGHFAKNWLVRHPDTIYYALETDSTCHQNLTNLGVNLINPKTTLSVDLVVISHVLEHVSNPIEFINMTTRNLKKGGVLFIEVPCNDHQHKQIDEPHLLFFDKKPLKTLLLKTNFFNIELDYYGKHISTLQKSSRISNKFYYYRKLLISNGLSWLFSFKHKGMEIIDKPIERAIIAPFKAHIVSEIPTWWLRSISQK